MSGAVTYRDNESVDEVAGVRCIFVVYVSICTYMLILI